jgi:hypothetical protein
MKTLNTQKTLSIICGRALTSATLATLVIGMIKTASPAQATGTYSNITDTNFYTNLVYSCLLKFHHPDGTISFLPVNIDKSDLPNFYQHQDQSSPLATKVPEPSYISTLFILAIFGLGLAVKKQISSKSLLKDNISDNREE